MNFPLIILLIISLIVLVVLIVALVSNNKKTPKVTAEPAATSESTPAPSVIFNMKRPSPQVTVYENISSRSTFRCPVCDSSPAPAAKYCQVCGQPFHTTGGR